MTAVELQSDDGAEARLLTSCDIVARMAGKARVIDAFDVRLLLQPLGEAERVAGVMIESRVQRAQSTQRHEAVERCSGDTKTVGPPYQLLMQLLGARDDGAADDVAVAVEVLGRRMNDEVGPQSERLLPGRRQKRVVDHDQRATRLAKGGARFDVGDAQKRIARRLDPKERCGFGHRVPQRGLIAEVHEIDVALAALPPSIEQPVGTAITIVGRNDATPVGNEIAEQRDGRHAGSGDDSTDPELEIRKRLSQKIARRIPGASVVVAAFLSEAAEGKGRRQMDRRHHRAGLVVAFQARAHGLRDLVRSGETLFGRGVG